jgi:predicted nucleic acid-binding protein
VRQVRLILLSPNFPTIRRSAKRSTSPNTEAPGCVLARSLRSRVDRLAQREHNADRWIAATALRLGIPPVSDDTIFKAVPGLTLESLA